MTYPYRIRSAETWVAARDDYLGGLTAEAVCRRHDLGLSAFRRRARRYGWRRVDQDDPTPADPDLSIYDDLDLDDEVMAARRRYLQALEQGRSVEAARWRRLWLVLQAENDRLDADLFPGMDRSTVRALLEASHHEDETEEEVRLLSQPSSENVHDVHPVFSSAHFGDEASEAPASTAHPRGCGDPVIWPHAESPADPSAHSQDQAAAHQGLGPRVRGDERVANFTSSTLPPATPRPDGPTEPPEWVWPP